MSHFPTSVLIRKVNLPEKSVKNTLALLRDGATIPFISRYRKEMTGSLDELQVGNIKDEMQKIDELIKRKETILKAIQEQGALTNDLKSSIDKCWYPTKLEDIYLPFKKKVKTKATVRLSLM